MSKPGTLKVSIPLQTMRRAGAWFAAEIARSPAVADQLKPDVLGFAQALSRCTASRIEIDRHFAERFAGKWGKVFSIKDPVLLYRFSEGPELEDGIQALADVVLSIKEALLRPPGRPKKGDPVEAFEVNTRKKATRKRSGPGVIGDAYAHESTAAAVGLGSKGTTASAIKDGREVVKEMDAKQSALPPGAEVLGHLVDLDAKPGVRVRASIVRIRR